jgi:hypothetical protein
MEPLFTPTPDVAAIINVLLDVYERRGGVPKQAIRLKLDDLSGQLPGYYSQLDPLPRLTGNEQLERLATQDLIRLTWQPGQTGHLLETVTLNPAETGSLYRLVGRQPVAAQRQRLRELLLGDRFRFDDWRRKGVDHILDQLKKQKSPTPFSLTDEAWNRDLLTVLTHLPEAETAEETPYRVFSVRVFNDSKRFEALRDSIARLARRHRPGWRSLSNREILREFGLVANPGHLYLSGAWRLVDLDGQVMSLAEFQPSVGIPAALVPRLKQVTLDASRLVCVENLTSFYELVRHGGSDLGALCLWGNPSPASRSLLQGLVQTLPEHVPLLLWADIDYGGLSILAQLRRRVSPRFGSYRMNQATLNRYARWAQPLSTTDERNLARLRRQPILTDHFPLIDFMLHRGLKLEQEAVQL